MPSANGKVTGVNGKITLSKVPRWQQGVFACDITPHVSFRLSVSLRGQARKTTGIPGRSERLYQAALLRLTSLARGDGDPTRRHYDIQQRDQLRQHFISTQALFANGRINGGQKPARLRTATIPHDNAAMLSLVTCAVLSHRPDYVLHDPGRRPLRSLLPGPHVVRLRLRAADNRLYQFAEGLGSDSLPV
ncbi:hypothetical protein N7533_010507 [Penicillium manginii]|uniref:uncharacterized protein n=1 Tax=Penicillium manginii TaxID=203109 RepID=UPI002549055F|nr:uncharacterized protein N7533_010507 [Penicillium manginii]KAJ5743405.1 hypothetical protein N7533_010507 [Penicillium manginii]